MPTKSTDWTKGTEYPSYWGIDRKDVSAGILLLEGGDELLLEASDSVALE